MPLICCGSHLSIGQARLSKVFSMYYFHCLSSLLNITINYSVDTLLCWCELFLVIVGECVYVVNQLLMGLSLYGCCNGGCLLCCFLLYVSEPVVFKFLLYAYLLYGMVLLVIVGPVHNLYWLFIYVVYNSNTCSPCQ